ncbi:hypothetical protein OHC33_000970 [Knufia fluminis]|uniref:BTB domain-containing protein n=1 Tax=Knufia fluminis TaxID=191047 RepID=A0AAN8F0D3_9EURO|nr:hypothetical protein OHC33_000970 [Knufia fluminis]
MEAINSSSSTPSTYQASATSVGGSSLLPSKYMQEKPVTILVGLARKKYYIFKNLLAAKSPYFAAQFKDCWDGQKDEVELLDATGGDFEVVVDWMHVGKLPTKLTQYTEHPEYDWDLAAQTYKLADKLMMPELQNEVLKNEASILASNNKSWHYSKLATLHTAELTHTPYYTFVLKSVVRRMMIDPDQSDRELQKYYSALESCPKVAMDVLASINRWNVKRWGDLRSDNLSEFLLPVANADDAPNNN